MPRTRSLDSAIRRRPRLGRASSSQAGWSDGPMAFASMTLAPSDWRSRFAGGRFERHITIIADNWRAIGAEVPSTSSRRTLRASASTGQPRLPPSPAQGIGGCTRLGCTRNMPSEENRWTGSNYGGYHEPRADGSPGRDARHAGRIGEARAGQGGIERADGQRSGDAAALEGEPVIAVRSIRASRT